MSNQPSVVKAQDTNYNQMLKNRIWSIENFSRWGLKWLWAILFFFTMLILVLPYFIDYSVSILYLWAIFLSYLTSNIMAYIIAYGIIQWIIEKKLHRKVRTFFKSVRFSTRKGIIQLIKFILLTLVYYFGIRNMLIDSLDNYIPTIIAFLLVWIAIGVMSDLFASAFYYIFKVTS